MEKTLKQYELNNFGNYIFINEFFCNGIQMSFDEMIFSFLSEYTGFSISKLIPQKQPLTDGQVKTQF
jgi:hypothetical protein